MVVFQASRLVSDRPSTANVFPQTALYYYPRKAIWVGAHLRHMASALVYEIILSGPLPDVPCVKKRPPRFIIITHSLPSVHHHIFFETIPTHRQRSMENILRHLRVKDGQMEVSELTASERILNVAQCRSQNVRFIGGGIKMKIALKLLEMIKVNTIDYRPCRDYDQMFSAIKENSTKAKGALKNYYRMCFGSQEADLTQKISKKNTSFFAMKHTEPYTHYHVIFHSTRTYRYIHSKRIANFFSPALPHHFQNKRIFMLEPSPEIFLLHVSRYGWNGSKYFGKLYNIESIVSKIQNADDACCFVT